MQNNIANPKRNSYTNDKVVLQLSMATKLTPDEKIVFAAMIGGSNFSYTPERKLVQEAKAQKPISLEKAIWTIWRNKISYDEPFENFLGECKWWYKDNIKDYTREKIKKLHPDLYKAFF